MCITYTYLNLVIYIGFNLSKFRINTDNEIERQDLTFRFQEIGSIVSNAETTKAIIRRSRERV